MTINNIIKSAIQFKNIRISLENFPNHITGFVTDVNINFASKRGLSLTFASGFVYDCDLEQEFEVIDDHSK
jgi:hypothetical protein